EPLAGHRVQADHYRPGPRLESASEVARGGLRRRDRERPAGAARPAAETGRPDAAEVEGSGGAVVFKLGTQPGRASRDADRKVLPDRREPVLEFPLAPVPHDSHALIRSDRS